MTDFASRHFERQLYIINYLLIRKKVIKLFAHQSCKKYQFAQRNENKWVGTIHQNNLEHFDFIFGINNLKTKQLQMKHEKKTKDTELVDCNFDCSSLLNWP